MFIPINIYQNLVKVKILRYLKNQNIKLMKNPFIKVNIMFKN